METYEKSSGSQRRVAWKPLDRNACRLNGSNNKNIKKIVRRERARAPTMPLGTWFIFFFAHIARARYNRRRYLSRVFASVRQRIPRRVVVDLFPAAAAAAAQHYIKNAHVSSTRVEREEYKTKKKPTTAITLGRRRLDRRVRITRTTTDGCNYFCTFLRTKK